MAGALIAGGIYLGLTHAPQQAAPQGNAEAAVESSQIKIREVSESDHVRGAAQAKVTVIEYSDLECPFCKQYHATLQRLLATYPEDVRWVWRHFPLTQLHSKAVREAVATECAAEQGKFWEMTDEIMRVTPANNGLDLATLPQIAQRAGVANLAQFEQCMSDNKYENRVKNDVADAQLAGGRGTPHTVIIDTQGNKEVLVGAQPFETVEAKIKAAL